MKKIRVLFTIPNLNTAGSGMALYKLLTGLNKDRFEAHVMCLHSKGALFQKFSDSGFKMHVLQYTHIMRPVATGLTHCWRVSKWLKENNFDIVYSYNYSADYSEAVAAKLAGCKWVFVKKNMGWFGSSNRAWRLRSFLADCIVVQNREMQRVFYPKSKKTTLISIGVDTAEYYPLDSSPKHLLPFRLTGNTKVIGVVANFVPVKGLEILIKAFALLHNEMDLRLVMIGNHDNDYGRGLIQLVEELKISEELVFFAGKQSNVNDWLNTFDLFVLPTLVKGEGAPIAIQEAVAAGTLVVGSKVCGIDEQLAETPEFLFEPGDAKSLSEKLKYVFSLTDEKLTAVKKKQKSHLLENYTLSKEVKAVEENLVSLVS